ncbi:hypothetical protein D8Y22_02605 [Salinadaptatus halalkaliphilus]|uniref:Uncharacterized protein n=1 Tax=Salinadaptatus halalkaliphilus TaxID=2419781 RepID=A0A4V3VLP2_9EURY|nr:hypothetical protein [Salinadaptatus halalkaliphilus]THE66377.1 hypothetical protein D8Y22_02605 [Salinadaptatus halalkaliphilus]
MSAEADETLPHLVTIVGSGVPSNYEITVDGEIELVGADPLEEATVVTNHSAEGAVETGVMRFRFSGEMANIHVVDWNGIPASDSPRPPAVHVDYSGARTAPNCV